MLFLTPSQEPTVLKNWRHCSTMSFIVARHHIRDLVHSVLLLIGLYCINRRHKLLVSRQGSNTGARKIFISTVVNPCNKFPCAEFTFSQKPTVRCRLFVRIKRYLTSVLLLSTLMKSLGFTGYNTHFTECCIAVRPTFAIVSILSRLLCRLQNVAESFTRSNFAEIFSVKKLESPGYRSVLCVWSCV